MKRTCRDKNAFLFSHCYLMLDGNTIWKLKNSTPSTARAWTKLNTDVTLNWAEFYMTSLTWVARGKWESNRVSSLAVINVPCQITNLPCKTNNRWGKTCINHWHLRRFDVCSFNNHTKTFLVLRKKRKPLILNWCIAHLSSFLSPFIPLVSICSGCWCALGVVKRQRFFYILNLSRVWDFCRPVSRSALLPVSGFLNYIRYRQPAIISKSEKAVAS